MERLPTRNSTAKQESASFRPIQCYQNLLFSVWHVQDVVSIRETARTLIFVWTSSHWVGLVCPRGWHVRTLPAL